MTYREAIKILERRTTIPDDDVSWEEIMGAIDLAIKAVRIVEVVENCFVHNRGEGLIDSDDWEDIKKFVDKEKEV